MTDMETDQVEAKVHTMPACDFAALDCSGEERYDFKTKMGPWANGCLAHWVEYRKYPVLGTGKGQKLILSD